MTIEQVILYLTPFLVWAASWIIAKITPLIPGWAMLAVVGVISGVLTYLTQLLANPEIDWWQQLLFGLLAVLVDQIKKQFSPKKVSADKAKLK